MQQAGDQRLVEERVVEGGVCVDKVAAVIERQPLDAGRPWKAGYRFSVRYVAGSPDRYVDSLMF
jgi:hypothetical protein